MQNHVVPEFARSKFRDDVMSGEELKEWRAETGARCTRQVRGKLTCQGKSVRA